MVFPEKGELKKKSFSLRVGLSVSSTLVLGEYDPGQVTTSQASSARHVVRRDLRIVCSQVGLLFHLVDGSFLLLSG